MILKELRKLSKVATSGPWNYSTCYGIAIIEAKDNEAIAHAVDYLEKSDAQFITEARNHFDALLDVAEAAAKAESSWRSQDTGECMCEYTQALSEALEKLEQGE